MHKSIQESQQNGLQVTWRNHMYVRLYSTAQRTLDHLPAWIYVCDVYIEKGSGIHAQGTASITTQ